MENKNYGEIIGNAIDIIKNTYKDINKLRIDFEDLLCEEDSLMKYYEEYSYGTRSLHLKANHTYLFRKEVEDTLQEDSVIVIICIFYEEDGLNRIVLQNQPEIWFGKVYIKNTNEKTRPWEISSLLKLEERKNFLKQSINIGGEINEYHWIDDKDKDKDNKQEWSAKFIGFPLIAISDKDFMKTNLIEKLYNI